MSKERIIGFWHGRDKKLVEKIASICKLVGEDYVWDGSLDEFAERYGDKFIVYSDHIYITQFNSWGPR